MLGLIRLFLIFTLLDASLLFATNPARSLIVAHRGLLHHAPENTLANFRACLELRLGFEFDVEKTKDGHLVCLHDTTVDRTTNGSGNVMELKLKEIRKLDAGSWFDERFAGEKVPTVEEILKLVAEYKQCDVLIAVDLKAENVETDVVRLADQYDVLHRLVFIGRTISEPIVRDRIKQSSKNAQTAVVANNPGELNRAVAAANSDWVYCRFLPSKQHMKSVQEAGKRAFIAGPLISGHSPDNWRHASGNGVERILTDYPLELRTCLRQSQPVSSEQQERNHLNPRHKRVI